MGRINVPINFMTSFFVLEEVFVDLEGSHLIPDAPYRKP